MHLYYYTHAKDDIEKLAELMTLEKQMRENEKSPSRSESPVDPRGLYRQANFIFRVINIVSAVVGFAFCIVGLTLFHLHHVSGVDFGSGGYVVVGVTLGLDGIALAIVAVVGLIFRLDCKPQMILYAAGGAALLCVMILSSILKLPDDSDLFGNVSVEMAESLVAAKKGNVTEGHRWDDLQTSLQCCGLSNFRDWCQARNLSQLHDDAHQDCHIPRSCFSNNPQRVRATVHKEFHPNLPLFEAGCYMTKMQALLAAMSLFKSFVYVMIIFLAFDVLFAGLVSTSLFKNE